MARSSLFVFALISAVAVHQSEAWNCEGTKLECSITEKTEATCKTLPSLLGSCCPTNGGGPNPCAAAAKATTTAATTPAAAVHQSGADLDKEQIAILKKAFDTFAQGKEYIAPDMVASILRMMGTAFTEETLKEAIAEIDEDGSGQIEFEEFTILASKFIIEEDDEDV